MNDKNPSYSEKDIENSASEHATYLAKRKAISTIIHRTIANADAAFEVALKLATSKEALEAAENDFKDALRCANHNRTDALKALGPPPEKIN